MQVNLSQSEGKDVLSEVVGLACIRRSNLASTLTHSDASLHIGKFISSGIVILRIQLNLRRGDVVAVGVCDMACAHMSVSTVDRNASLHVGQGVAILVILVHHQAEPSCRGEEDAGEHRELEKFHNAPVSKWKIYEEGSSSLFLFGSLM